LGFLSVSKSQKQGFASQFKQYWLNY